MTVIIAYFTVLFSLIWLYYRLHKKRKRKELLECPKTGIYDIDPNEKTPCAECAKQKE